MLFPPPSAGIRRHNRRPARWRPQDATGPDRMRVLRHHHTGTLRLRLDQRQPRRRHAILPRPLEAALHLRTPGARPAPGAHRGGTGAGARPQPQAQGDVQQVQPLLPRQTLQLQASRLRGRRPTHRGVDIRPALLGLRNQGTRGRSASSAASYRASSRRSCCSTPPTWCWPWSRPHRT